jgi:hypothetical protein
MKTIPGTLVSIMGFCPTIAMGQRFSKNGWGQALRLTSIIPATQEAEIGRLKFQGQSGKKLSRTLSQSISHCVLAHACDPSYTGGIGRRISV